MDKSKTPRERRILLSSIANDADFWSFAQPELYPEAIEKIPEIHFRRYFYRRWGYFIQLNYQDAGALKRLELLLKKIPLNYQADFMYGRDRFNFK